MGTLKLMQRIHSFSISLSLLILFFQSANANVRAKCEQTSKSENGTCAVIRGNEDLHLSAVTGTNIVNRLANETIPVSVTAVFV